jgi:hypothetical protein
MSLTLPPVAKALHLCDDVVLDPASRETHLFGNLNAIQPAAYPHRQRQICVYAQRSGGIGELAARVEITQASTRETIHVSPDFPLRFEGRQRVLPCRIRLRELTFRVSGAYFVELYYMGNFLDDRLLYLLDAEADRP